MGGGFEFLLLETLQIKLHGRQIQIATFLLRVNETGNKDMGEGVEVQSIGCQCPIFVSVPLIYRVIDSLRPKMFRICRHELFRCQLLSAGPI